MTREDAIEYWERFNAEIDDLYDICSDVDRDIFIKQREAVEFTISALRSQQEQESNDRLQSAMNRLGRFGKLFVEYKGCPRGAIGRACAPLEDEVFAMPEITDVDGGRWVPVNADALRELVNQYKRMMTREERNAPLTLDELRKMDGEDEK